MTQLVFQFMSKCNIFFFLALWIPLKEILIVYHSTPLYYSIVMEMYFTCFYCRIRISLNDAEARVHFALVCGAKSCPPIKTYSAEVCVFVSVM